MIFVVSRVGALVSRVGATCSTQNPWIFRRQDSLEAVHRVLHFEFSRCLGGCSWEGMADMLVSKQHVISWESKVPPPNK